MDNLDLSTSNNFVEGSKFEVDTIILPLVLRETSYAEIKSDLLHCMLKSNQLCFFQSQKWAADLLKSLGKIKTKENNQDLNDPDAAICRTNPDYFLIQSAMTRYQYGEAMLHAKSLRDNFKKWPLFRFLYFYNKYLHGQSQRIQNAEGPLEFACITEADLKYLMVLREELKREDLVEQLDPLMNYLYGTILRQLGIFKLARERLVSAIAKEPRLWCFWLELADCIFSKDELECVLSSLPRHWMRDFFLGRIYMLLNMSEEAYGTYKNLRKSLFTNTSHVMTELAKVHLNRREPQECIKLMEKVRAAEPGRIDDMDFYSNVLYVKGDKTRLAKLVRELHESDPFAPETNVTIANYYSLRDQHDRAIEHLVLALRSFPEIPFGWLTLGHEYFELKNYPRASQCYQKAVELNPRDYRAHFGLGQAHEAEEKFALSIFHYQKSVLNSCYDLRPWIALGNIYKKNNQLEEAARAYWQAYLNGEKDDGAIVKLAKIYEAQGESRKAIIAFERAVELYEEVGSKVREDSFRAFAADLGHGHMVLAESYLREGRVEEAKDMARKAEVFSAVIDEARAFLQKFQEDGDISLVEKSAASGMDMEMSLVDIPQTSSDLISDDDENLPT